MRHKSKVNRMIFHIVCLLRRENILCFYNSGDEMIKLLINQYRRHKPNMTQKETLCVFILFLFVLLSLLYISPKNKEKESSYHSSQLRKYTVENEDMTRTDFIDEHNRITIASDLGYSTVITETMGNEKLEKYYDDQGKQAYRKYSGYYGVLREYNQEGKIICISYLDADGEPMITTDGYAKEKRVYCDDSSKTTIIWYYDEEDNPVLTKQYGYGQIIEYNTNGEISKHTYIDLSGEPMMTGRGYASVIHNHYIDGSQNGKIESEFYYDDQGDPVALSLGQYGVYKEYDENGRETAITYLGSNGETITTNKGYSTVVRSYQADNKVATERYYDAAGNPFALAEGQYGIRKDNGQEVYLNQNGKQIFNMKNLLYNHSVLIIFFSLITVTISFCVNRQWNIVLLVLCLGTIVYLTLMYRENESERLNLQLFWSYRKIFTDNEIRASIIKNIWLFLPLGAILYKLYPKKIMLLVPVIISIFIETLQYITGTGLCELDDIISNGLGGYIGFYTEKIIIELALRKKRENIFMLGKVG